MSKENGQPTAVEIAAKALALAEARILEGECDEDLAGEKDTDHAALIIAKQAVLDVIGFDAAISVLTTKLKPLVKERIKHAARCADLAEIAEDVASSLYLNHNDDPSKVEAETASYIASMFPDVRAKLALADADVKTIEDMVKAQVGGGRAAAWKLFLTAFTAATDEEQDAFLATHVKDDDFMALAEMALEAAREKREEETTEAPESAEEVITPEVQKKAEAEDYTEEQFTDCLTDDLVIKAVKLAKAELRG